MNNNVDEILLKLQSVIEDEQSTLYVCDKEHCKILLNYIKKLNILINELYTIVYYTICNDDVKNLFKDKLDNLKKYEENIDEIEFYD